MARITRVSPIEAGFYTDPSGNRLHVNDIAEEADTGEQVVVYIALQGERSGKLLARNAGLFKEELISKKYEYLGKRRPSLAKSLKPGSLINKKV